MADLLPDSAQDSLSASEDEDIGLLAASNPLSKGRAVPSKRPEPPLATKADLKNMLSELKAFFASELAVLKEDLNNLTGRMRATEEDVHDLKIKKDT
ncbi:Hypothetical predicted protein [Pelobates cultripes]|uniref:Uncharacterized protein n=1 Tax=Pelobates cultripes TaxID=61616 RepID=A0AAD1R4N4_PELCU|nr:Hypothetical predicted protein [Pelobates cultripes]CAH2252409.1 Hypothetical predicted protein [Pelobates cultripes]